MELLLSVLTTSPMSLANVNKFHFLIRHYLCVSLLKNCTSGSTKVVSLSLKLFVPLIRHFRHGLKTEIEVLITNIFFVIVQSPNSSAEHKSLVINLFEQVCSDPKTLAEIFLNYDCDLSAVDLFHRIVSALERSAKSEANEFDPGLPAASIFHSPRLAMIKQANAGLRLDAMKALVRVLASLYACIDDPSVAQPSAEADGQRSDGDRAPPYVRQSRSISSDGSAAVDCATAAASADPDPGPAATNGSLQVSAQTSIVEIYDSKKKLKRQISEAVLRFNNSPKLGIRYAGECGLVDPSSPEDVARYLLENKDRFDKTVIGEYLGREREYMGGFCFEVLHKYAEQLDFTGLVFDDAIRHFLAGFRLPGEAQKIDRIMEKFAERFSLQNPAVFPSADVAFILAFSVIMLNTDLHNPSMKEERRMTKEGFIRNNRGISTNGTDLPQEMLEGIFDRIQKNQISLKEDEIARERVSFLFCF